MGQNRVTLYKRPNNKLELAINGFIVKSNFTSAYYDSTTKSEINTYLATADGINRLDGDYTDVSDSNLRIITDSTNNSFSGANQVNINFIDLT